MKKEYRYLSIVEFMELVKKARTKLGDNYKTNLIEMPVAIMKEILNCKTCNYWKKKKCQFNNPEIETNGWKEEMDFIERLKTYYCKSADYKE